MKSKGLPCGTPRVFFLIPESPRRLAALNRSFWADESCSYIYLSLEGGKPRDSAIERSPDRFLAIQLGDGGHQAEMQISVYALRKDRFFGRLPRLLFDKESGTNRIEGYG